MWQLYIDMVLDKGSGDIKLYVDRDIECATLISHCISTRTVYRMGVSIYSLCRYTVRLPFMFDSFKSTE